MNTFDAGNADAGCLAEEVCGGGDENCDGQVDEDGALGCQDYYQDVDGDGFGAMSLARCLCAPDGNWDALTGDDCDDARALCTDDCSDPNINGTPDCDEPCIDPDGDGFGDGECAQGPDCDETDPTVSVLCCVVVTTAASGDGSLSSCLASASVTPGMTVTFALDVPPNAGSGAQQWWRISTSTTPPLLVSAGVKVHGGTQTLHSDANSDGPEIEVNGGNINADGFRIGAPDIEIEGIAITNFNGRGVRVSDARFVLEASFIGVDPAGVADGNGGDGVYIEATDVRIGSLAPGRGNVVAYNSGRGLQAFASGARLEILGNHFHHQNASPFIVGADDMRIIGNVIENNGTCCNYDELIINNSQRALIAHNTIYGAGDDGILMYGSNVILANNVVVGSGGHGIDSFGSYTLETHNLVTSASTPPQNGAGQATGVTLNATTIDADPLFVSADSGDFQLSTCASPAVNAGIDLGAQQPDLNGDLPGLFNGASPDIGAHQTDCP